MGAAEFVYEGNMKALAMDVYAGCILNSTMRMCFFTGGKICMNMLPPEIHKCTKSYLTSSASV